MSGDDEWTADDEGLDPNDGRRFDAQSRAGERDEAIDGPARNYSAALGWYVSAARSRWCDSCGSASVTAGALECPVCGQVWGWREQGLRALPEAAE